MQEQLVQFFGNNQQAGRLFRQLKQLENSDYIKPLLTVNALLIPYEQFILKVQLKQSFLQLYCKEVDLQPIEFSVVYGRRYPAQPPRLYFSSDNLNQLFTVQCRSYFNEAVPNWTPETTFMEILEPLAGFIKNIRKLQQPHLLGTYIQGQYIDVQHIAQSNCCELYPVTILMPETSLNRYLLLNRFDMVLLEQSDRSNYLWLVDVYSLKSITSIRYFMGNDLTMMLEMDLGVEEVVCEFNTYQRQRMSFSIIDRKLKAPSYDKPKLEVPVTNNQPIELQKLYKLIQIQQSKLAEQPLDTEPIVTTLISLYNQAIQYCSLVADGGYQSLLQRLQRLISMQITHSNQKQSIFDGMLIPDKQVIPFDSLHDISQITTASTDIFQIA